MTRAARSSASASQGALADTFGWDTVYAIRYTDVNAAIVNDWPSPPLRVDQVQSPASIAGDFAPWRVVTGGSGHLVHMETPVPALAYDTGGGPTIYDATVEIEVALEFVPQPPSGARAARDGTWMDLRLKTPGANMAAVVVLEVTYAGAQPSDLDKAVIQDLFRQWFNDPDNLQAFNTVFCSVNLNAKADVDEFQWLSPTHVSYAVAEEDGLPDGVFGVLCMTENRDPSGLAHQISAHAIPEGQRSAFLISRERYLSKLLMPGVAMMFSEPREAGGRKWPEEYFELIDGGTGITNTAPVRIERLEIEEGQEREAAIPEGGFTVRFGDTALAIDFFNMQHDYRHGLNWLKVNHTIQTTATAMLREGQRFALEPGDGSHTIVVTKDPTAEWIEIGLIGATLLLISAGMAKGIWRTWSAEEAAVTRNVMTQTGELVAAETLPEAEAAVDAAAGATGVVEVVGGGAARSPSLLRALWSNYRATAMAGMSTLTASAAGIMKILEFIADQDSQKFLPAFDEFAAGAMAPVQWPHTRSEFEVKAVAFRGSLQAAGDPGFAD